MPILLLLVLFGSTAYAQSSLACTRVDSPGVVRAEGLAELLPDIVLDCQGGQAASEYSVLLTVQGAWALRPPFTAPPVPGASPAAAPLPTPIWNEAMLLIDDPLPTAQRVCLPALNFSSCAPAAANIFPARRLENNLISFTGIPIAAPGNGKRRLRISNLRVNVPLSVARAAAISTLVQMFDAGGNPVQITGRDAISATAQPSYSLQLLDARGNPATGAAPALLTSPAAVPLNAPIDSVAFHAAFEEAQLTAFRRRNIATTPAFPGSVQSQNVPGLTYNTESGFFDTRIPLSSALSLAGTADSGTRLRLNFENLPKNILVWVSIRDAETGTGNYDAANPKALLTYTNPNGDGPFSPVSPYLPGWAQLYVDNGKAQAVWEVVSADPSVIDRISFRVALTSQGSAGTGAATLRGSIAPFLEGSSTATLHATPRFQVPARSVAAFTLTNSLETAPASFTSAASFSGVSVAPSSFAAAFVSGISSGTVVANHPWPTTLNGIEVQLIDATGASRRAQILLVSSGQINFLVPPNTALGPVLINVNRQGLAVASGLADVRATAPGLFSADGSGRGVAAGTSLRLSSSGSNPAQPLSVIDAASGLWRPVPIAIDAAAPAYLSLYGTGIRNRPALAGVTATIGGQSAPILYAGPQSDLAGLDQINIGPLPASLKGRGELDVVLSIDGVEANTVRIAVE
jgi:uncharacterized protein (TIGR03437 family)